MNKLSGHDKKQAENVSTARVETAKSRRYIFMDVLRVLSFFVILFYHFFKDIAIRGISDITDPDFTLSFGNVHLVKVAVGMFFLISGAGLGLKYSKISAKRGSEGGSLWDGYTLRDYFSGRFKQILVPFYIVYIIYAVITFAQTDGTVFSDVPLWRVIFTPLALDNYLIVLGVRSFALSVGEWFLSVLIVMYMLFPAIYTLLKKYPRRTMILGIIYFVVIAYTADRLRTFLPASVSARLAAVPWHMDFFIKICEFALGVFLGIYLEEVRRYPLLIAAGLLVFAPIHPAIINTALILALFVIGLQAENAAYAFSSAESSFARRFASVVSAIAGLSYYIYLIHHIIIYKVDDRLAGRVVLGKMSLWLLFAAEIAVMTALALLLRFCTKKITHIDKSRREK